VEYVWSKKASGEMAGLLIFARTEGSVLYLARSASEDCRGVGARLLEFTLSTLAVTDTVDLRCWAEHHRLVRWYRRRGAGTPYRCVQATQRWRDGWCYVTYMSAAAAMRNGCSDDDETESDEDEDEEYTGAGGRKRCATDARQKRKRRRVGRSSGSSRSGEGGGGEEGVGGGEGGVKGGGDVERGAEPEGGREGGSGATGGGGSGGGGVAATEAAAEVAATEAAVEVAAMGAAAEVTASKQATRAEAARERLCGVLSSVAGDDDHSIIRGAFPPELIWGYYYFTCSNLQRLQLSLQVK
jgi:hypothetical protein